MLINCLTVFSSVLQDRNTDMIVSESQEGKNFLSRSIFSPIENK